MECFFLFELLQCSWPVYILYLKWKKQWSLPYHLYFYTGSDTVGLLVQTISPLYVIANIAISARETRILHFYQPVIFLFIYILVNLIYCATTGSRVYTAMHWTGSPIITIAISLGILLVFTSLVHLFVYGIFRLRTYLTNKKVRMDEIVLDGTC